MDDLIKKANHQNKSIDSVRDTRFDEVKPLQKFDFKVKKKIVTHAKPQKRETRFDGPKSIQPVKNTRNILSKKQIIAQLKSATKKSESILQPVAEKLYKNQIYSFKKLFISNKI